MAATMACARAMTSGTRGGPCRSRGAGGSTEESAYFMKRDAGALQSATPVFVTARKRTITVDPCARPVMVVLACSEEGRATQVLPASVLYSQS
jgi:hypothetical protein